MPSPTPKLALVRHGSLCASDAVVLISGPPMVVLRMLADFVGEDVFLRGVSIYLKKLLYKNSVTKDLWDGVSESSGIDVNKMMAEWILKVGL